jgi:hypothetical protein
VPTELPKEGVNVAHSVDDIPVPPDADSVPAESVRFVPTVTLENPPDPSFAISCEDVPEGAVLVATVPRPSVVR